MDARQNLGRLGEAAAERALVVAGFRVLDRRSRQRGGELDLVAEIAGVVVFVEVKTRRRPIDARPADAVTLLKRHRMVRAALAWLARRGWGDRPCRFDVVEVWIGQDGIEEVRHLDDAFRPGLDDRIC